jgi:hypothetical protein
MSVKEFMQRKGGINACAASNHFARTIMLDILFGRVPNK